MSERVTLCHKTLALATLVSLGVTSGIQAQRRWQPGSWVSLDSAAGRGRLLVSPGGLACSEHAIFIYDFGDHTLKALTDAGRPLWRVTATGAGARDFQNPTDVQVDSRGRIWVADLATLAVATGFLVCVALACTYLPARATRRIDPIQVLR